MFAASAEWTATASSWYGASRTAAPHRSRLEIIPAEIDAEEVGRQLLVCRLRSR